ncbi:hypothetical protein ACFWXR_14240 [[Kitasatospora] papulosa]|uniref:hypothetical protein n=1 Tax=[Kitasatospora] papulosa TaxID=1464011 RepID=UPI003690504B
MNSQNSSGRDATGRTDLPASQDSVNPAHLVEIAQRAVGHSESLVEQVMAWQIVTRPYLDGTRGLARWSSLSDKTVRETAGPEGGLSEFKFFWTRTRGTASPTMEDREEMRLRFHSNCGGDYRSTSPKTIQAPEGPLGDLALEEKLKKLMEGNAVVTAAISEKAQEVLVSGLETLSSLDTMKGLTQEARTLRALDASLDVWSEVQGPDAPEFALGRQAWKLAILSGLRDVTLSSGDIAGLLGLAPKSVRDLLARMTKAITGLVRKVRQGRSFVYEVRWAQVFDEMGDLYDERVTRHEVRNRRAAKDRAVQEASARRGTPAGFLAYRLSSAFPKRDEYLAANPLPQDADEAWRALVAAGDELAMYEHLRKQEAEAGPVPSTPAVLVKEAPERRPAQESPESTVVPPELLVEMRRRIIADSYR